MINLSLLLSSLPSLLTGLQVSLCIAFLSSIIGTLIGIPLAFAYRSRNILIRTGATIYATIIRGTPMLLHIFFFAYVLPHLLGIRLTSFWAATWAIGINSSAYISQIIRSGIQSINTGQIEAAQVLGMTRLQTIRYIILPQAIRVTIPSLGNELITLVKDSSLASIIGVMELTKVGRTIIDQQFDAITIFAAIGILYLIVTSLLSVGLHYLEHSWNNDARN